MEYRETSCQFGLGVSFDHHLGVCPSDRPRLTVLGKQRVETQCVYLREPLSGFVKCHLADGGSDPSGRSLHHAPAGRDLHPVSRGGCDPAISPARSGRAHVTVVFDFQGVSMRQKGVARL
jgi:hypothetical protein